MAEPTRATIPLHVVAVEIDGGQLDCCDDDPVHVWVSVTAWSGRRAVLVQGTQFATAAGCPPEDLPGKFFLAELDLHNPPPFEAEPGERIDFPGLRPAPAPPAEWMGTGLRQTVGGPVSAAAAELRAAAQRLLDLADETDTDMESNSYWHGTTVERRGWFANGIDNAVGGPAGLLAGLMSPATARALAELFRQAAKDEEYVLAEFGHRSTSPLLLAVVRAIGGQQP